MHTINADQIDFTVYHRGLEKDGAPTWEREAEGGGESYVRIEETREVKPGPQGHGFGFSIGFPVFPGFVTS